jgi:putative transcriptional regulator
MNKKQFADLLAGVGQMGRHMRGKSVPSARVKKVEDIQARKIRLAVGLSQSRFAHLIGVPVKTLQNWEQNRTRPAGTARALLRIVQSDPKTALKALHMG